MASISWFTSSLRLRSRCSNRTWVVQGRNYDDYTSLKAKPRSPELPQKLQVSPWYIHRAQSRDLEVVSGTSDGNPGLDAVFAVGSSLALIMNVLLRIPGLEY